jgi:aryl-alcohol dehydrogenase-like predicted oxidoreductase
LKLSPVARDLRFKAERALATARELQDRDPDGFLGTGAGGEASFLRSLERLKIQRIDLLQAMRKYPLDFIQVDYSLANRDAASSVLPVAPERHAAVLVNLPLARAALIGQARSAQAAGLGG